VLGREFAYELIEPVAQRDEGELASWAGSAQRRGIAVLPRVPLRTPSTCSSMRWCKTLPTPLCWRGRRQELHARVAATLEEHFADLVERQPELLAHHLTAADITERAVDQWLKAGQHAAARLAHLEAIRHSTAGLRCWRHCPKGCSRRTGDRAAVGPWPAAVYGRGVSFGRGGPGLYPRPRARRGAGRCPPAVHGGLRPLAIGQWLRHCPGLPQIVGPAIASDSRQSGRRIIPAGSPQRLDNLYVAGEPAEALEHCEAGRRLYDPERHRSHRLLYGGHDPGVCACQNSAMAHWRLGYPEKSLAIGREALSLAERIGHPFSLELILVSSAVLHLNRGEADLALQRLGAAEKLVFEQRLAFVQEPRFLRGAALTAQGAFTEAVACLREGLASRLGATRTRPYGLVELAEALTRQGEHGAALLAVREAWRRKNERVTARGMRNFIASKASRFSVSAGWKRVKTPSKRRCASREAGRQRLMSCALQRASPGCGANRAGGLKGVNCLRRFTAGSPRASIPPI